MEEWASEIGSGGDAPLSSSVTSLHCASLVTVDSATLFTVNMADDLSDKHACTPSSKMFSKAQG